MVHLLNVPIFLNLCERLQQIFPSAVTVTEHSDRNTGSSSVHFGVLLLVMAST